MTDKKMRKLLKQIYFHHDRLSNALNAAHSEGLISYVDYKGNAPCESLWECRQRVEKTTAAKIAQVVQDDAKRDI